MSLHHLKERMAEQDGSSNDPPHVHSMKQQLRWDMGINGHLMRRR